MTQSTGYWYLLDWYLQNVVRFLKYFYIKKNWLTYITTYSLYSVDWVNHFLLPYSHNVWVPNDTSSFITKYIILTGSENWSDFFHPLSGFLESKNSTLFIRLFAFGLKNSKIMIKICLKHPIQGSISLIQKCPTLDSFTQSNI